MLSEVVSDTIWARTRNDGDRIAGRPHHSPDSARQSVFARNPGDGPDAAAGCAAPFPGYRMERASARVNAVGNVMHSPRPWDFKDEGRGLTFEPLEGISYSLLTLQKSPTTILSSADFAETVTPPSMVLVSITKTKNSIEVSYLRLRKNSGHLY